MHELVEKEPAACVRFSLCISITVVAQQSSLRPHFHSDQILL